jgi:hypothetical protein
VADQGEAKRKRLKFHTNAKPNLGHGEASSGAAKRTAFGEWLALQSAFDGHNANVVS